VTEEQRQLVTLSEPAAQVATHWQLLLQLHLLLKPGQLEKLDHQQQQKKRQQQPSQQG
jgi:hypothetical protein